jgi:hypothetical protein
MRHGESQLICFASGIAVKIPKQASIASTEENVALFRSSERFKATDHGIDT